MPIASLSFHSRILGRSITTDTAHQVVDVDDLEDVTNEVGAALMEINARIRSAGGEARSTGRHLPPSQWAELQSRRSAIAALHQQLLSMRSRARHEREQISATLKEEQAKRLPDLSHFFQQVVRNEASPVDYQRWALQAEMRRTAEANHQRQQKPRRHD